MAWIQVMSDMIIYLIHHANAILYINLEMIMIKAHIAVVWQ